MLKKKRFSLKKTDDITDAEINRRRRRSIGGDDEGRMLSGVVLSKDEKWNKWREQRIESEDESDKLGRRVGKLKLV